MRRVEGAQHDALGVGGVVVEAVLGALEPAVTLGVVARPQPEREHGPPGLLHDLLAQLDGLGEDDLLLRVEERHLADLLEVHAHRVVDADHVLGHGIELGLRGGLVLLVLLELGRGLLPGLLLALLDADLHAQLGGGVEVASAQVLLVLGHDDVPVHVALAALQDRGHEKLVSGVHRHVRPPCSLSLAWVGCVVVRAGTCRPRPGPAPGGAAAAPGLPAAAFPARPSSWAASASARRARVNSMTLGETGTFQGQEALVDGLLRLDAASGQRVRARQERPRDPRQGGVQAGHEGGPVEGAARSARGVARRPSRPSLQRRPSPSPSAPPEPGSDPRATTRAFQSSRAGVVTKGSSAMRASVAARWLG